MWNESDESRFYYLILDLREKKFKYNDVGLFCSVVVIVVLVFLFSG